MTASAFNCCTNHATHLCTTSQNYATRRKNIDFYSLRRYFDISKQHLGSELINMKKQQRTGHIIHLSRHKKQLSLSNRFPEFYLSDKAIR